MLGKPKNQFPSTRAALSRGGQAESNSLPVPPKLAENPIRLGEAPKEQYDEELENSDWIKLADPAATRRDRDACVYEEDWVYAATSTVELERLTSPRQRLEATDRPVRLRQSLPQPGSPLVGVCYYYSAQPSIAEAGLSPASMPEVEGCT